MHITAGVGFRPERYEEALASPAEGLWFEVQAESYMVDGEPRLAMLETLHPDPIRQASQLPNSTRRAQPLRPASNNRQSRPGNYSSRPA